MKHFILVSVEIPETGQPRETDQARLNFLIESVKIALRDEESRKLAPGVWLLQRDNEIDALSQLVTLCKDVRLPYEVRFLSGADGVAP